MGAEVWLAVWLTVKLASLTTIVLLIVGVPLAWWLARDRSWWTEGVVAIVALPLVLPPTVLGFYLLLMLGRDGPVGGFFENIGLMAPAFTFEGVLAASVIYSLPFMVQPVRNAFLMIGDGPLEAAATLRASPLDQFWNVALPLVRPSIITGAVMSFAHTVGEFGVVLMVGGNIEGETRVASTLIYDLVEMQDRQSAHWLSAGMAVFALSVVLIAAIMDRRTRARNA